MKRSKISAYLLAGKLLHMMTLIEIVIGYIIVRWLLGLGTDSWIAEGFRVFGIAYMVSLPVFAQLDARSRYQNYKQIRDQFTLYGFDTRILKPVINSRCQRDAAQLAASETGYGHECLQVFRKAGYRWYHLFPDFVLTHPWFLFTWSFWRTTFFCPSYRSKL